MEWISSEKSVLLSCNVLFGVFCIVVSWTECPLVEAISWFSSHLVLCTEALLGCGARDSKMELMGGLASNLCS